MGSKLPMPYIPLWPYASNYDLHDKAGGLPLLTLAAPNVRTDVKA